MRTPALLIAFLLGATGCVGGFATSTPDGRTPEDFVNEIPPEDLVCPADPDCAIGGDCSLYECPDHWICEGDSGDQRCVSPGPDYPDRGNWDCADIDGDTVCTSDNFPDGGGGDGWNCELSGDLVVCTDSTPDYPDGGGGDAWSCYYDGDLRVCSNLPGDGGGWTCWVDESGRHCRHDRDIPGDGGNWTCYDVGDETHCDGGDDYPGGGGDWECEMSGGEYNCVDRTPDYPDGGGGDAWSCHFTGEFRVCDSDGGGGDDGGWTCWVDETGRHCRTDRDIPGDGGDWTCFDFEGESHCDGGGDDYPGGGGDWDCEMRGGEYYCIDTTPDYPDGGGGGSWSCRYTREFRVCDGPGDGPGDGPDTPGDVPRDCAVTDPLCGSTMCTESMRGAVTFIDNEDGNDNGEIAVLGDGRRDESCATVRVGVTAYYALYDDALAESCNTQRDEISYVTIANTCNADGNPVERNVGDRFVIGDVDNTPFCSSDAECSSGSTCQSRSAGYCCVPTAPAFVGTFLLIAGEDNRICLHHVCPEVRAGTMTGADSFISADCRGSINSVHLQLDGNAFICPDPSLEFPMACGL